ncbi:hypothetical protein J4730_25510 [Klebsiella pneumoniae]|uniref:Uncharacterized protein n=1 Tax=Klebsiella pneumoniae TaxID=573 RepID=A0A939NL33_KLEPN|nr:hypothetical protein [Klebsiella pneumoniae]
MSIRLKDKPSLASRIEKFNKHHVFHENSVTHCRDYLIKMMQQLAPKEMPAPFSEEKPVKPKNKWLPPP